MADSKDPDQTPDPTPCADARAADTAPSKGQESSGGRKAPELGTYETRPLKPTS